MTRTDWADVRIQEVPLQPAEVELIARALRFAGTAGTADTVESFTDNERAYLAGLGRALLRR